MNGVKQPLISIIVPVYKVEKYLRRCVDSILTQTYQNIEVILVNDGSPDNCGAICDKYKEIDNRIVVIHKKNGGLSEARNVAIPLAKGKYISFVDSDDWISPYYVEHLYKAVAKCDADMGISWFENVFEGKALQSKPEEELSHYECLTAEECLKKLLYQNGVEVCAWGKLYKTGLIKDLRYPVGKFYEDIPVTYESVKRSKKISVIGNIDYYYFQRTDSIQNVAFNVKKLDGIEHCHNMMNAVGVDFPELKNAAKCRYFSTVCNILFQIKDEEQKDIRRVLWMEVVKYRKDVLFDTEARKKARIAAAISYMGYKMFAFIYRRTQWRGKLKGQRGRDRWKVLFFYLVCDYSKVA